MRVTAAVACCGAGADATVCTTGGACCLAAIGVAVRARTVGLVVAKQQPARRRATRRVALAVRSLPPCRRFDAARRST
jgi:hypothetical protein